MLSPAHDDPNRKEEQARKRKDPNSFGRTNPKKAAQRVAETAEKRG